MKKLFIRILVIVMIFTLFGCKEKEVNTQEDININEIEEVENEDKDMRKMNVQIGEYTFIATLESNEAVDKLIEMMEASPVTIKMDDYSGFEKVGSLNVSLPRSDKQTTTNPGDIVLYNGSNIVIFYGNNSWSYTRIGHIDNLENWTNALGSGSVEVTFLID